MNRTSWDEYFMQHAELAATRSTCARMQTGAVLVRDHRCISEGYNGVAVGQQHCVDHWRDVHLTKMVDLYRTANINMADALSFEQYLQSDDFKAAHHDWSNENEIHGEQNCILFAARNGIGTFGTTMFTVYSPCINCAKVILQAGIKRVVYRRQYYRDANLVGVNFLLNRGIDVNHLVV